MPAAIPGGSCEEHSQPISGLTARLAGATLKRGGEVAQSAGTDSLLLPGIDYRDAAVRKVALVTRGQANPSL